MAKNDEAKPFGRCNFFQILLTIDLTAYTYLHNLAEKRRKALQERRMAREKAVEDTLHLWEKEILPDWRVVHRNAELRKLWWRGIPTKLRAPLWEKAVGNELALSKGRCQLTDNRVPLLIIIVEPILPMNRPLIRIMTIRSLPHMLVQSETRPYFWHISSSYSRPHRRRYVDDTSRYTHIP